MAYLIPKSARNVKIQLFKGLGISEIVIVIIAIIIGFLIFSAIDSLELVYKIILISLVGILTIFLVSPSFFVNKKGYQSFTILVDYFFQPKKFKNRGPVK